MWSSWRHVIDATPGTLPRRQGDPVGLVADASKARQLLDWTARHGLAAMVDSAWRGVNSVLGSERTGLTATPLRRTRAS